MKTNYLHDIILLSGADLARSLVALNKLKQHRDSQDPHEVNVIYRLLKNAWSSF